MSEQLSKEKQVESVMVYVAGSDKSFRCECGCNCFHHPEDDPELFECNGCELRYVGEV
jgi:hypothetical protein